jgi:hypothetical protein
VYTFNMKIDVTQEDIALGQAGDPWNCPIALAARRAFGRGSVRVGGYEIRAWDGRKIEHYLLPLEARRFQLRFDTAENPRLNGDGPIRQIAFDARRND